MPRHPLSLLLVGLSILLLGPPPAAAQENEADCDSICLLPAPPPTTCACDTRGGGAGPPGGGRPRDIVEPDWGPPGSGGAMLMELVESYEERIATVNDYTVVASVNGSPPVVLFYEKVMVEYPGRSEHPIMQQVSQREMTRRQSQSSGAPTPEQFMEGLGTAAPALAGLLGGVPTDGLPSEARVLLNRVRAGLTVLPGAMGGIMEDPGDGGPAYGNDVFWDPGFLDVMVANARIAESVEVEGTVLDKLILSDVDYDFSALTEMDITRITLWSARDGDTRIPIQMRIEGWNGLDRFTLQRRWDGRAWVGPMNGARSLVDVMDDAYMATTRLDQILINQGLPSAADVARLLQESARPDD